MSIPKFVKVVEVSPRDGLQNEATPVTVDTKVELIQRLSEAGITYVEAGSFVSPKWVPKMADTEQVYQRLQRSDHITYAALTPNLKGLERAVQAGANEVAVFAAASETFSKTNINCSIQESLERFQPVVEAAQAQRIPVRGYVSCVLGCPYEGYVYPEAVKELSDALYKMGCREISLGDTIGTGTPTGAQRVFEEVSKAVPIERIAAHFHDTYGQALANLFAVLEMGVSVVDASVAGLGGCPYAKGASGNVATEDVIYMLHGIGIDTGVDLNRLIDTGNWISDKLNRCSASKVASTGYRA